MSARAALYHTYPGFFDLAHVRASAPQLSALGDDALVDLLLDADNATPPAPNVLFDVHFYTMLRTRQGQVQPRNPIVHYLTEGAECGLPLNALFDVAFYQRSAALEGLHPIQVVEHALNRLGAGLAPFSPFVDIDFICAQTGRAKDADLLAQLFDGALQIDRPHPLVDLDHLRRQTVQRIDTLQDALFHYWTCGADLSTHPLIDTAYYRSRFDGGQAITHGAYHYLVAATPASPHALFDPEFYRAQAQVAFGRMPRRPLEHFVTRGQARDLSPSPFFDVAYYRAQSGCGVDAMQHYLQGGYQRHAPHPMIRLSEARLLAKARGEDLCAIAEGLALGGEAPPLALVPEFSLPFMRKQMNAEDAAPGELLRRYLREGYPEGWRPNGLLSLPYIEAQCVRYDVKGCSAVASYFECGWHRRQRVLIALADTDDTPANRAWLAICRSQLDTAEVELVVVSAKGGALSDAFGEVAHVWHLGRQKPSQADATALAQAVDALADVLAGNLPLVGFVDCSDGTGLVQALGRLDIPLIAHGDAGLGRLSTEARQALVGQVDQILCASPGVQAQLAVQLQELPAGATLGVHGGFHLAIAPPRPSARQRQTVRAALGIGDNDLIVLASGGPEIEYGADLFGALVAQCCEDTGIGSTVQFLWHGPGPFWGNQPKFYTRHFARTVGGDGRLHMIEAPDLATVMAAADVYVKLGRDGCPMEDVLQARAAGLPVVLMRGGADQDALAEARGVTAVDAFDLRAARHAVRDLVANPQRPRDAADGALRSQLSLANLVAHVATAIRRHVPDFDLAAPGDDASSALLVILPDEDLFAQLAKVTGLDHEGDGARMIRVERQRLLSGPVSGQLPPVIATLLSEAACASITVLPSPSGLTPEHILRFHHAIWLTRGTEAELRDLYLHGLSFDAIHSLKPGQIDAMRALNPRVAAAMQVTDWRAQ